jgi:N-acetylglucosamine malate deacetylase 1
MILVISAHPDDEVLGCGASIAKWSEAGEVVHILIMAEGATSRDVARDVDAKNEELSLLVRSAQQAGKILGAASVKLLGFPDNRLDVVKAVEAQIEQLQPHTVVTHHCGDVNIDHWITHEAVVTACRPQPDHPVRRLLSFEVPSSTEWQPPSSKVAFQPNWFEDVSETLDRKIKALKVYKSEMREWPHARSVQSVEHLARWRGSSVGCDAAEAFILLRELK